MLKLFLRLELCPGSPVGAYSAPLDLLSRFKGPLGNREGRQGKRYEARVQEGEGEGKGGKEGEGRQ